MDRRSLRSLPKLSLALLAIALLAPAAANSATRRTYVAADCSGAVRKPHAIVLACGDAGLAATNLRWSSWTATTAVGQGSGEAKICEPDCAAGRVARGPMRLKLLRPRLCPQDGRWHFTKVQYSWTHGPPAGAGPKAGTVPLPCSL